MATLPPDELWELMVAIANASIKRTTALPARMAASHHDAPRPNRDHPLGQSASPKALDDSCGTHEEAPCAHRSAFGSRLALLEAIKPYSGHREYVFPADWNPRTHCNSQTANMALKRMSFRGRLVSHGLRSIAKHHPERTRLGPRAD